MISQRATSNEGTPTSNKQRVKIYASFGLWRPKLLLFHLFLYMGKIDFSYGVSYGV